MPKLTDWEVGQELTKVFDELNEARVDIKESKPEISKALAIACNIIGKEFNKLGSHGFLLPEDLK